MLFSFQCLGFYSSGGEKSGPEWHQREGKCYMIGPLIQPDQQSESLPSLEPGTNKYVYLYPNLTRAMDCTVR